MLAKSDGRALLVILFFAIGISFPSRVLGQTANGIISGDVRDESGAVIPGVSVSVSNVETGISRSLVTDSAGRFRSPLGAPDRYFDSCVFTLPPAGTYGNLGRNTLIGPGLEVVDFSLIKMTSISERAKLDFRAEFFNVLNRANFDLPNAQIFGTNTQPLGSAGRIQNTKTTSRQIQFALKLSF